MAHTEFGFIPQLPVGQRHRQAEFGILARGEFAAFPAHQHEIEAGVHELLPGALAYTHAGGPELHAPSALFSLRTGGVAVRVGRKPRRWSALAYGFARAAAEADLRMFGHHLHHQAHPIGGHPVVIVDKADNLVARFLNPAAARVACTDAALMYDPQRPGEPRGPAGCRHFRGAVGGGVVHHQHFPSDLRGRLLPQKMCERLGKAFRAVMATYDDAYAGFRFIHGRTWSPKEFLAEFRPGRDRGEPAHPRGPALPCAPIGLGRPRRAPVRTQTSAP